MGAEGFVGRWSRLKRSAGPSADLQKQHEALEDPSASPVIVSVAAAADAATAAGSVVPLDAAGKAAASPAGPSSAESNPAGQDSAGDARSGGTCPLPDIESLGADSDLSMFMSAGVDPQLRVRALRKLFTDPHFNRMDGLDVYIDDYSKPDPMPLAFIRRLAQSRILGLSDEPAHGVPGEADAATSVETAVAANETAASNGEAVAGGAATSSGTLDGPPGRAVGDAIDAAVGGPVGGPDGGAVDGLTGAMVGGATAAAGSAPAAGTAQAAAVLDRTAR